MDITQVRVFPVHEDKLKAFVSIIIDDCFVVSDIKIIQGTSGLFVSMPSKKRKNGTFRDIAHPLNNETRRRIEKQIIAEYRHAVADEGGRDEAPLRELHDGEGVDEALHERSALEAAAEPTAPPEPAPRPDRSPGEDSWT